MNILAVETSGYEGTVALMDSSGGIQQRGLPTQGRRHAQTLVREVDQLLKSRELEAAAIDAVAVSIGPGSFTGLRVGVVFAKTFAWANKASLVAVNTMQAVAQRAPTDVASVTVISDAQRNEVFVSDFVYDRTTSEWATKRDVEIVPVEAVLTPARVDTLWTGPGLSKFADHFDKASCAEPMVQNPSATSVAEIARAMSDRREYASIHDLEPLYIRRSYAEEKSGG